MSLLTFACLDSLKPDKKVAILETTKKRVANALRTNVYLIV